MSSKASPPPPVHSNCDIHSAKRRKKWDQTIEDEEDVRKNHNHNHNNTTDIKPEMIRSNNPSTPLEYGTTSLCGKPWPEWAVRASGPNRHHDWVSMFPVPEDKNQKQKQKPIVTKPLPMDCIDINDFADNIFGDNGIHDESIKDKDPVFFLSPRMAAALFSGTARIVDNLRYFDVRGLRSGSFADNARFFLQKYFYGHSDTGADTDASKILKIKFLACFERILLRLHFGIVPFPNCVGDVLALHVIILDCEEDYLDVSNNHLPETEYDNCFVGLRNYLFDGDDVLIQQILAGRDFSVWTDRIDQLSDANENTYDILKDLHTLCVNLCRFSTTEETHASMMKMTAKNTTGYLDEEGLFASLQDIVGRYDGRPQQTLQNCYQEIIQKESSPWLLLARIEVYFRRNFDYWVPTERQLQLNTLPSMTSRKNYSRYLLGHVPESAYDEDNPYGDHKDINEEDQGKLLNLHPASWFLPFDAEVCRSDCHL